MEVKITVPAKYIAVLKLFAGNKNVRYYLNGINLEISATGTRLVGTDGHRLGVFCVQDAEWLPVPEPLADAIIPNELLTGIKPTKGSVTITIGPQEAGTNSRPVVLEQDDSTISGKTIDGKYPAYRRVIPRKVSGEAAQFNANYIGDLGKASRILHGKTYPNVNIGHNGPGAALISFGIEEFVGVLMPLRGYNPCEMRPPAWACS